MTIVQLKYLLAVSKHGSFAKAAKKSFVTQPTLSMQIINLEDELGIQIFDRTRHPLRPTDIGAKIIEQAKVIIAESGRMSEIILDEQKEIKGKFRLGILPTISPYLVPLFIQSFIEEYPNVELTVNELQTSVVLEQLGNDGIDAAIIATPVNRKDFIERHLYFEPFMAYISENHPMFTRKKLDPNQLDNQNVWLLEEGHCFRDQVLHIGKSKVEDEPVNGHLKFEAASFDILTKLVESNFGYTFLPYLAVKELTGSKKMRFVREFKRPIPTREITLVTHRSFIKQKVIEGLEKEIKSSIPEELRRMRPSYVIA